MNARPMSITAASLPIAPILLHLTTAIAGMAITATEITVHVRKKLLLRITLLVIDIFSMFV